MIITREQQHSAMQRRSGGVAVLQCVAAAVDPRSLGVPQGKYAVVFGARKQIDLLASPNCRCSEFLVDRRLKVDVAPLEKAAGAPQSLIEATQR